ncbi:ribonuclease P protein component [Candidatus Gottesmanbacteria bacterium RBG_13_45_10]|uniref:Ribonuclease P protein component n=1 Tax=Candidatus Gottesmanbacteria bacterium RBG_13_45_10 TaxID=1798370 RepID=A0A1F5ZH92_9BACT|nr:MAG: ribonuclease P protein component [Candidatus Gottesmanbacteria bacterium RBG_13_45_10]
MLPRCHRLPSFDTRQVLRAGKRITDNNMQLIYQPAHVSGNRFAFVVGTRVDKRATVRNRVRRLLRESVQHSIPSLIGSWDVVVIAKKPFIGQNQKDVEQEIRDMFIRGKLVSPISGTL